MFVSDCGLEIPKRMESLIQLTRFFVTLANNLFSNQFNSEEYFDSFNLPDSLNLSMKKNPLGM